MKPTDTDIAFAADVRHRDERNRYYRERYGVAAGPLKQPTNNERSRAECIEFHTQPLEYGRSYGAYLTRDPLSVVPGQYRITTWTGDTLAYVTSITTRRVRSGYTTDTRGSFWALGIDGRTYYGRHNGAGMHCTLRLSKHQ